VILVACTPAVAHQTTGTTPQGPKPTPDVQAIIDQSKTAVRGRKFDEALALAQRALQLALTVKDQVGEAAAHQATGEAYGGSGQHQKALDEYSLALPLCRAAGDRVGEAKAISASGVAEYNLGQPLKAKAYFEQALPLYRTLNMRSEEAGMMMNIAVITENTGDAKGALPIYDKVLPIFRELKNRRGEANTLANIALAHDKLDESAKSIEYHLLALEAYREIKDLPGESLTLNNLSGVYSEMGQYAKSLEYANQSLDLARKLSDKRAIGAAQLNIGRVYRDTGDIQKALATFETALQIGKEAGDARTQRGSLSSAAVIYSRSGQPQKALESFQQVLALDRQLSSQSNESSTLLNIGFLYADVEQSQIAKGYFEQVLARSPDIERDTTAASALVGLGTVAQQMGRFSEALAYDRRGLTILRKQNDPDTIASILGNIASIELESRQYAPAKRDYTESLALFRAARDNYGVSTALNGLGQVAEKLGDVKTAAGSYTQAAAAARTVGIRQYEAGALTNLGRLQLKQHQLPQAEENLRHAVALLETIRQNFGSLVESQSGYFAKQVPTYRALLDVLLNRALVEDAFEVAQKLKARALLDLLASGNVNLSSDLSPEERNQEEGLRQRADYLNTQMVKEGVQNAIGAKKRYELLREQLRGVERDLQTLTETLYARHPQLARRRVAHTATALDLDRFLPSDTAFLEYIALEKGRFALFVATRYAKTRPNVALQLSVYMIPIKHDNLAKQTADFRAACSDPRRSDWRVSSSILYALLVGPARKQIAGKRRLIISPDGPLWDVPFQALTFKEKFLADSCEVTYAASATGLLSITRDKAARSGAVTPIGSLLAFANPSFGTTMRFGDIPGVEGQRPIESPSRPIGEATRPLVLPSRNLNAISRPIAEPSRMPAGMLRGGHIADLPGTQREADALKQDFRDALVVTGSEAQEATAKQSAGKYRYLHFASHGFFNDVSPLLSSVVLAEPPAGSTEDGFLTAREIFGLDLRAVELATLSACNTARGTTRTGEGVIGLTWALAAAGVPSQVVSQWSVDDASTAVLMKAFYANMTQKHMQKGQALHQAGLSLRQAGANPKSKIENRNWSHPYYWAPFVLMGDWR